jgi:hypothetical protein
MALSAIQESFKVLASLCISFGALRETSQVTQLKEELAAAELFGSGSSSTPTVPIVEKALGLGPLYSILQIEN